MKNILTRSLITLDMFSTPFENNEVVLVYMFFQDLTRLCIYLYQYQYLIPQKMSFYSGYINNEVVFIIIDVGL